MDSLCNSHISLPAFIVMKIHQLLICMPQLSSTSKYPCHLGDKEDEVGREKLHPLMLTDKDRQLNKRDSNQHPLVAQTQP